MINLIQRVGDSVEEQVIVILINEAVVIDVSQVLATSARQADQPVEPKDELDDLIDALDDLAL